MPVGYCTVTQNNKPGLEFQASEIALLLCYQMYAQESAWTHDVTGTPDLGRRILRQQT
jgi:hypothetical protein